MLPYQEQYLELLHTAENSTGPSADGLEPEQFVVAAIEANRRFRAAVETGTALLRENLFPLLGNILSASKAEIDNLGEFADSISGGDVCLNYHIHLALMSYARHYNLRDMLIKELYYVGMALYNLEYMLRPNMLRLYTTRMRMYFAESASYFDTEYDNIEDPEIRGFIHRSMGNIALAYDINDAESATAKLAAVTRSINILSDPDVRAKTPSLPWDTYLYKSHQERTSLLGFLRSGNAGPEAFAQVLESAQIVQDRQLMAAREKGDPLQPRWQYTYMAAKYHSGSITIEDFLDSMYIMSGACADDDFGAQSMFTHVNIPAVYINYAKYLNNPKYEEKLSGCVQKMMSKMFSWIVRAPDKTSEQLIFYIKQILYVYNEYPGCPTFFEVVQNFFAACHPTAYVRMWIAGQISKQLTLWAIDDCPEKLVGLVGCKGISDVIWNRDALADFAVRAGRLYDIGMFHFVNIDASACRGLFQEEQALLHLHSHCGAAMLDRCRSTAVFADIAKGHHCRFDEKGGYPVDFYPSESPVSSMIYIVAAAGALSSCAKETASRYRPEREFDEVCESLEEGSGKRYAPFVAELLKSPDRREQLRVSIESWKSEAYLDMYRRREQMK